MKKFVINIYKAIDKMIDHDGVEHSGYMSFMLLLSIFPFCIFMLAFTSFLGNSELGERFIATALENMPEQSIDAIKNRIDELMKSPTQSLLTLAIFGALWTSSSFVECVRTILNRVYHITTPPSYITRRLLSIFQFLLISTAISFMMLILVIIPIILAKIPQFMVWINGYNEILTITRYLLVFSSLILGVGALYYIIPNRKMSVREVLPGALITVSGWICSGFLLSKFIRYYNQLNVVYGSLAGMIITLIFFYIINMIFIVGAEFNYINNKRE